MDELVVLKETFEKIAHQLRGHKERNTLERKRLFFPSGTMAQQIALRIWCDEAGSKKVAYHPLSHLEIHEKKGLWNCT